VQTIHKKMLGYNFLGTCWGRPTVVTTRNFSITVTKSKQPRDQALIVSAYVYLFPDKGQFGANKLSNLLCVETQISCQTSVVFISA